MDEEARRIMLRALRQIAQWDQALQDRTVRDGNTLAMWRGCVAVASLALEDIGEPKEAPGEASFRVWPDHA
jgi:hypothetical protein